MFLEIKDGIVTTNGFLKKEEPELDIFISGYIIWNEIMYWGEEFIPILISHYKENSIKKNINDYNGIFYFIIADNKKVTIAIDRYGFYPLMYKLDSNHISISNSSDLLIKNNFEWNDAALVEYLTCGFTIADKTIAKGICEFKPHRIYTIELNKQEIKLKEISYWQLILNLNHISKKNSGNILKNLISQQFDIYSDFLSNHGNKILMPISGGLDSRFLLNEFDKRNINSLLITFGGNNKNYDLQRGIELGLLTSNSIGHYIHINSKKLLKTITELTVPSNRITNAQFNELYYWSIEKFNDEIPFFISGQSGGFLTGGHMRLRMKRWKKKEDVINYIARYKTSPFYAHLSKKHKDYLYEAIFQIIPDDISFINMLYVWEIENRQRKFMARYCFFEGDHSIANVIMPFYNYKLIDFFTSISFDELLNQRFFIRCMKDFIYSNNKEILQVRRVNKPIRNIHNQYVSEYLPKFFNKLNSKKTERINRQSFIDTEFDWHKLIQNDNCPDEIGPYLYSKLGMKQYWAFFQLQKFSDKSE